MKKFSEAFERVISELEDSIGPAVRRRIGDDLHAFLDRHEGELDDDEKKVVRRAFHAVEEAEADELVDALIDASQYFTTSAYAMEMSRILSMVINQEPPPDEGSEYSTSLSTDSTI